MTFGIGPPVSQRIGHRLQDVLTDTTFRLPPDCSRNSTHKQYFLILTDPLPQSSQTGSDVHQVASRHYAFEGRCFVVAAGQILKAKDLPEELELPANLANNPNQFVLKGGSCVIGPDGKYITEPIFDREEIILADIDPEKVYEERMTLDVSGHYQRNDIFSFEVNNKRRP